MFHLACSTSSVTPLTWWQWGETATCHRSEPLSNRQPASSQRRLRIQPYTAATIIPIFDPAKNRHTNPQSRATMSAQSSRTASPLPANVRSIAKIQNDLKDLDLTSKFSSESLLRLGRLLAKEGYSESELAHLDCLTGWGSVLLNRCIGPQTETQYLKDEAVETEEALSLHPIDRLDVLKSSLHH